MMKRFLLLFLMATGVAVAAEKVDHLGLGATLLKDGYAERAKRVLEKADVREPGFDFARYYTLKGIMLHKTNYPTLSNIFFGAARERGQDSPSVYLYEAKNYWQLEEYRHVIEAIEMAGAAAKDNPQMFVLKAEAYKRLGEMRAAWAVLDEGIGLYPEYARFYKQKFYYLLKLGFFRQALVYADRYLKANDYSSKDYLAVAYALRENHRLDDAAAMLEEAVLKYGYDGKLVELLGQVYIDQQHFLMAALVYDRAAVVKPQFAHKAAVLYLKAKQPVRSLQLNRRIINQKDKFKQRIGIDIYLDDYERLVAEADALKRYDLLSEDSIAYALGYGYFRVGDYDKSKALLKRVTDDQLFTKASHIFKQIDKCNADPIECY